jgi:hypothetical protein
VRDARPATGEYRAKKPPECQEGHEDARDDRGRGRALRLLVADEGPRRGASRGRCSRARCRTRRGASARSATTWWPSMTPCAGATTGSSGPSRRGTPSGFATLERMRPTASLPDSMNAMRAAGGELLPQGRRGVRPREGRLRAARERSAQGDARLDAARKGARPCSRTTARRRGTSATACLGLTFKSKANSIDPDVIEAREAVERPSATSEAMVLFNEGETLLRRRQPLLVAMAASSGEFREHPHAVKRASRRQRSG